MTARPAFPVLRAAVLAVVVAALMSCGRGSEPTAATAPLATQPLADVVPGDPIVIAAGDISCGTGTPAGLPCKDAETAALIGQTKPTAVLLLGDNQYENATLSDFNTYYQPTWGAYKAITYPSSGNHEYNVAGASGYFDYFNGVGVSNGRAGERGKGYYSFNLGAWHVVVLNSNCGVVPCTAGSAQEQWLRADLAANPAVCTLATWHHPRFSSGSHGNNSSMQAIWQALYDFDADLVLAGHDHDYERFGPQTATGGADATRGIRSFIVGTGGKELAGFGAVKANSQLRNNSSLGVLKLSLHAASFDWQFLPIPGHTLGDAGTAACHGTSAPPPPPPPPPSQTTLTIVPTADAYTFRNSPNTNFGSANPLLVDGSPAARSYFKFAVTGLAGKTIVSARLRVYAVDPSDAGGRLHRVTSTSWLENTITWNNAPSYSSTTIGSVGAVATGNWYEIDVKSQVTADGTYSFALESTSTNGADYSSRESGANAPRLVIVVQ